MDANYPVISFFWANWIDVGFAMFLIAVGIEATKLVLEVAARVSYYIAEKLINWFTSY